MYQPQAPFYPQQQPVSPYSNSFTVQHPFASSAAFATPQYGMDYAPQQQPYPSVSNSYRAELQAAAQQPTYATTGQSPVSSGVQATEQKAGLWPKVKHTVGQLWGGVQEAPTYVKQGFQDWNQTRKNKQIINEEALYKLHDQQNSLDLNSFAYQAPAGVDHTYNPGPPSQNYFYPQKAAQTPAQPNIIQRGLNTVGAAISWAQGIPHRLSNWSSNLFGLTVPAGQGWSSQFSAAIPGVATPAGIAYPAQSSFETRTTHSSLQFGEQTFTGSRNAPTILSAHPSSQVVHLGADANGNTRAAYGNPHPAVRAHHSANILGNGATIVGHVNGGQTIHSAPTMTQQPHLYQDIRHTGQPLYRTFTPDPTQGLVRR